ncbi:hypothetical protein ACT6QH_08850 [Xanthobacter sp. TB0139]|uniref:hypothetical protein n=1 Tax=Xanthobacter sp. TB0139 TaxID=3459178 RepID=UPI004039B124
MSESSGKLPFVQSLQWSIQWSVAIVLRHQLAVAAYMAAGALVGLLNFVDPLLGGMGWLMLGIASIGLALLTHNEVLRGEAQLDSTVLGHGGGRLFSYLLDCILLILIMTAIWMGPSLLMALLFFSLEDSTPMIILAALVFMALSVVGIVVVSRLALRLPSRALGTPMPWADAWAMGRGNTLKLVFVPMVLSIPFVILGSIGATISMEMGDMVQLVLLPLQVVLSCAFLSVAYGRLRAEPAA